MSDAARFRKGFLLALVIAITAAFVFVVKDFLMTVFVAAIFSGLVHPLYQRLLPALGGRKGLAAFLTLLIVTLVVGGPLVAVLTVVTNEAMRITDSVAPWVTQMVKEPTRLNAYLDRIPGITRLDPYREQLLTRAGEVAGSLGRIIVSSISSTTRDTLALVVDLFLMLYAMFFFLVDGSKYLDRLAKYLPLRESEQEQMLERFVSVTRATLKGTLLIGIVQGALGGVDPHVGGGFAGSGDAALADATAGPDPCVRSVHHVGEFIIGQDAIGGIGTGAEDYGGRHSVVGVGMAARISARRGAPERLSRGWAG